MRKFNQHLLIVDRKVEFQEAEKQLSVQRFTF